MDLEMVCDIKATINIKITLKPAIINYYTDLT